MSINECISLLRWIYEQQEGDEYALECLGYVMLICQDFLDGGIDDISKT